MKKGLVTITMPVYNGEKTLSRAIDSVIRQTYENWELIVIDDASTDGTIEVLQRYQMLDSRIKVFRNKINRGTYYGRNRAILLGRGTFITNLDADDSFEPEKLALQVNCLGVAHMVCISLLRQYMPGKKDVIAHAYGTLLFRKSILEEIGYFDSVRYGADTEYYLRMVRYFPIVSIDKVLYNYFYTENSLTNNKETALENKETGLKNKERLAYGENFRNWHRNTISPYLAFPQIKRAFPFGGDNQAYPKEKLTVSLVSFPKNIESLRNTLDSIYPWVDQINIFLNQCDNIPDFLRKYAKINLVVVNDNRGDTSKSFVSPTIQGYHFICDDDIIYSRQYFETLLNAIEKYNRAAIVGIHGILTKNILNTLLIKDLEILHLEKAIEMDKKVQLLGTCAIAYHTDKIQIPLDIFTNNHADVSLGAYAEKKHIPLIRCASKKDMISINPSDEAFDIPSTKKDKFTKFSKKTILESFLFKMEHVKIN